MFVEPVTQLEIPKIVNKMKPKTSYGHDEISTKLIKDVIFNIIVPLTHIINRSILSGICPDELKIAKIIPIYKASDARLQQNYRPISLLPSISKVYETVMFNKIITYLNSNQILYKHQYGFRPKCSTIHPILQLLDKCAIVNNRKPKETTLSVLCDLSKAFDVINHKILLKKLDHYGIRGIPKMWLENYLTNRTQYVEIDNTQSKICNITCGVPQGSILGPLLYLIYVNDIANCTTANILSFADDTTLFISDSDITRLYKQANTEMANLFNWFCANKLSMNPKKTKYILLHTPHNNKKTKTERRLSITDQHTLKVNGTVLSQIGNNLDEISSKYIWMNIYHGIHIYIT